MSSYLVHYTMHQEISNRRNDTSHAAGVHAFGLNDGRSNTSEYQAMERHLIPMLTRPPLVSAGDVFDTLTSRPATVDPEYIKYCRTRVTEEKARRLQTPAGEVKAPTNVQGQGGVSPKR